VNLTALSRCRLSPVVSLFNTLGMDSWNGLGIAKMTNHWHPKHFLELAQHLYGPEQSPALARCAWSVSWKLEIAQYHITEALTAIPKSLPEVPDKRRAASELALLDMSGWEEAKPFSKAQLICEAHAIAAAQALHSVTDILSHVVYLGLGLEGTSKPLSVGERSLYSVLRNLEKSGVAPKVTSILRHLSTSDTFRYLRAYVNTTKHVSLVKRAFGISLRDEEPNKYGLVIQPFRYEFRGTIEEWSIKWMDDFLNESMLFVSGSAVEVSQALEEFLVAKAG
jgi:hypothetical protein